MAKNTASGTKITDQIMPTTHLNPEDKTGTVRIFIDPQLTRGGLSTNGIKYVGWVDVDPDIAQDLQRRVDEIQEINNWMFADTGRKPQIRIKNHFIVEQQFLAEPEGNRGRKGWTDDYGLLDPWQWQFLSKPFKEQLVKLKQQMHGIASKAPID